MKGYLVQQGPDSSPIYWNANFESSSILSKDPLAEVKDHPFNLRGATIIRDLWDSYGKGRCTFKVIELQD